MPVPLGPIRTLTVHCVGTPVGREVGAVTVCEWDIEKFGQVSYHWVIERDGTMVRTLPDAVRGAHVRTHNTGNIGICYVGGVATDGKTPKDTRTPAQKRALRTLIRTYQARVPGLVVRGHRDWPGVAKACPSFDVGAWLAEGMPA